MQNVYEKDVLITSTYSDRRCEVGLLQAGILIQDAMTEFFHQYRCDALAMSSSHHAVWAIARTKLSFEKDIFWMDRVHLRAFPVKISGVAVHLNVLLESLAGEPLLRARQELCPIDVETHKLRRVDSTPFPMNLPTMAPIYDEPYRRIKLQLGEKYLVYSHPVRTMDTDMNQHVNNTTYFRLITDVRPSAFWDRWQLKSFDIHHVNEAVEGQQVQIFCQETPGELDVQIKREETTLVKAFLELAPREKT